MQESTSSFACDLAALTPAERERLRLLMRRFRESVVSRAEQSDGYRFALRAGSLSILELAEWLIIEHQCCPFFTLRMEAAPDGLSVSILGPTGVKPFIQAELGLGA